MNENWCLLGIRPNPVYISRLGLELRLWWLFNQLSYTHIVVLCNMSRTENVICSVQRALMLLLMCNEYEGFRWTGAFVLSRALALVMRLLVQMGVTGAEGWQSCRYTEWVCACVPVWWGGLHACLGWLAWGADQQATGQRLTPDYITNLPQASVLCQYTQHWDLDCSIHPSWHTHTNTH